MNKIYIYKLVKDNLIEITTEQKRHEVGEEEGPSTELLFCIEDGNLTKIVSDLREYNYLPSGNDYIFKCSKDIYQYFSDKLYLEEGDFEPLDKISESEAHGIEADFNSVLKKLKNLGIVEAKQNYHYGFPPKIVYRVDVYNYLSDQYGDDVVRRVLEFKELSKTTQDLIFSVNKVATKDRKLKFINENVDSIGNEIETALQFLPEWYRLSYKISGQSNDLETREKSTQIEFTNTSTLGKNTVQIQKELFANLKASIFDSFDIGKTYSGSYILVRLKEIYKSLGIEKTAKIKDIYEFFDYKKVNLRYHISEYKLITRKII